MAISLVMFGWCIAFGCSCFANGEIARGIFDLFLGFANLGIYFWNRK